MDFRELYNDAYYRGQGADPLVDYEFEIEYPSKTVRAYEWRGITDTVSSLVPIDESTRWLDYGCGSGGLVKHLMEVGVKDAMGYEQGWNRDRLTDRAVPSISEEELVKYEGYFDVVTAIEVIEHAVQPVAELRRMRSLLRPGGLLFLTTGNARPFRDKLLSWNYVMPDIHVSYFEPSTLAIALERSGFRTTFPGYRSGWSDIVRYKVLKTLGVKRKNALEAAIPWALASRVVDKRYRATEHPVGWAAQN